MQTAALELRQAWCLSEFWSGADTCTCLPRPGSTLGRLVLLLSRLLDFTDAGGVVPFSTPVGWTGKGWG